MEMFTVEIEFIFSDDDESKVLGLISNGHDLDGALELWHSGLLENEYFIAESLLEDIKNYLEEKYEFSKNPLTNTPTYDIISTTKKERK